MHKTLINVHRYKDSVWNYNFLLDYFGVNNKSTNPNTKKQEWGLRKISITKALVNYHDAWLGQKASLSMGVCWINIDSILLASKKIACNEIVLSELDILTQKIERLQPNAKTNTSLPKQASSYNATSIKDRTWDIVVNHIDIKNSSFIHNEDALPGIYSKFDTKHIGVLNANIELKKVSLLNEVVKARIINCAAKERCGFNVLKLKGDLVLHKKELELKNLFIATPNSEIKDYISLSGNDLPNNIKHIEDEVMFNTNFEKSYVSPIDIAYFTNTLPKGVQKIYVNGSINGILTHLNANDVTISTGNVTRIKGNLTLDNITKGNNFIVKLTGGSITTNVSDIAIFVPSVDKIIKPDIKALDVVTYNGNAEITKNNYLLNGIISSALGNIEANGFYNNNSKVPSYSANVNTYNFKLGKLLKDNRVGDVNFKGVVRGSGLTLNDLLAQVNGEVRSIVYQGKQYNNMKVDASIKDKILSGTFESYNDYLKGSSAFTYDLSNPNNPSIKINSKNLFVDLQRVLNLNSRLLVSGKGTIDITGDNIDNIIGSIHLKDATLISKEKKLNFTNLDIVSTNVNGNKSLTVKTDALDATLKGKFLISKLPQSFQSFLYNYYPNIIKRPAVLPPNQNFSFEVNTSNIGEYIANYVKDIEGLDNSTLKGTINTSNQPYLDADILIPYAAYKNYKLSNIQLVAKGDLDTLRTDITLGELLVDSISVPNTQVHLAASNDNTSIRMETSTNSSLEKALLQAQVTTLKDGIDILFQPSNFIINNKTWSVEEGGYLSLSRSLVNSSRVKFSEGIQEVEIKTDPSSFGSTIDLTINTKHINMGDFMPYVLKTERIEGDFSGETVISDPFGDFNVSTSNVNIKELRFNDEFIGNVDIEEGSYTKLSNKIIFKAIADNPKYKFTADGNINLKDSINFIDINLDIDSLGLGILNKYLSGVFYDVKGIASGRGHIYGSKQQQFLTGEVTTKGASLAVQYTKVPYRIADGEKIIFREDAIDFEEILLRDALGGKAYLRGELYHDFFKNFRYYFTASTKENSGSKENSILLIDTREVDNEQFYGRAIGTMELEFLGAGNNMSLYVGNLEATDKSSWLTLPDQAVLSSGLGESIKIREIGVLQNAGKPRTGTNLDIEIAAKLTDKLKTKVIIDAESGDAIEARGFGDISLKAGTRKPLSIVGKYTIGDSSTYTFSLNNVIRFDIADLSFKIKPGGFIEWFGDPSDAQIGVTATYTTKNRLDLYDLSGGAINFERGTKDNILVSATLSEKLFAPRVKFDLALTRNEDSRVNDLFNQVRNDSTELLRQASTVIFLNRFFPVGGASNNNSTQNNGVVNGVSSKLLNTITGQITSEITRFFNDKIFKALGFNFSGGFGFDNKFLTGGGDNNKFIQGAFFSLSKDLYEGRLVLNFDSDLDFATAANISQRGTGIAFLPNIYLDYYFTSKKTFKASIYYKSSFEYGNTLQRNRMGFSIKRGWDF